METLRINANLRIKGMPVVSEAFLLDALRDMRSELSCYVPPSPTDANVVIEMTWDKFLTYRNTKIEVAGYINIV